MRWLILLIACIASLRINAQFTIKEIYNEDKTYRFPILESSARPGVTKAINKIIQTGELSKEITPQTKDPFENGPREDEYDFAITANNERIFSISLSGSHTGCGFHETINDYLFDSRTGRRIGSNEIFDPARIGLLKKALCKVWKQVLKGTDQETHDGAYKTCLKDSETITELDFLRMCLLDNGIRFWAGQCLDGSEYSYDETKGPHDFDYPRMLPVLSSYGLSLFVEKGLASSPAGKLMRGLIDGKYPFSMVLLPGSSAIGGYIVYDKVGDPLALNGTAAGNVVSFHEIDNSGRALSDIEVTWDGTKLSGTFKNLKNNKPLSFLASVVK